MNSDMYWSMMHRLNQGRVNTKQIRKQYENSANLFRKSKIIRPF